MKISKEFILKLELVGDDYKIFKEALEKVILAESANNLGIGILKEAERKLLEQIVSEIQK